MKRAESEYESRALAKGLQLLRHLTETGQPCSLTELSAVAGLGKASTLRLLHTLEATRYLLRDSEESYLVDGAWPSMEGLVTVRELRSAAAPAARELNAEFSETVTLAFLYNDHIRVVDVYDSPHNIRMSNYNGRILPPYASSLGKAIASFQTPEHVRNLLDVYGLYSFTPNTISEPAAIHEEFALVRERGYSVDDEESVLGGVCHGAPIADEEQRVVAAISISVPKLRLTDDRRETVRGAVMAAAKKIESAYRHCD